LMFVELGSKDNNPMRGLALGFYRGQRFIFNGALWLATDKQYPSEDIVKVSLLPNNKPEPNQESFDLRLGFVYQMQAFQDTRILMQNHPNRGDFDKLLQIVIDAPRSVRVQRETHYWRLS
jgi:hypothetical protein